MGLDMYLTASRTLVNPSSYRDSLSSEEQAEQTIHQTITQALGLPPKPMLHTSSITVEVEAIYWRKANGIHKWFVNNVQDGKDECQKVPVSREQLIKLRDTCSQALLMQDPELLPPQDGFFFGSDSIDDWYWSSLRHTLDHLNKILTQFDANWHFYYQSSW